MPVAIYAQTAGESHWNQLWEQNQLDQLLAVAGRDPLSNHLQRHLPLSGLTLEGGCGLGQYVLYFRQKGYRVIGGDFSLSALWAHHRQRPEAPLAVMDLRALPFAGETFTVHISLGVVEHLENGPAAIVREMARTLKPGGIALVSVPWVNGLRTLFRPLLRRRENRQRQAGLAFYQYLYTRREIRRFLRPAGLEVVRFYPYSPAKGLREFLPVRRRPVVPSRPVAANHPLKVTVSGARRLLYWPPILALTAHMILAVAVKKEKEPPL